MFSHESGEYIFFPCHVMIPPRQFEGMLVWYYVVLRWHIGEICGVK